MSSALDSIAPVARKETLGAIVREELRSALMDGRFRPGEKLTIRAVANALNVSLTPAREALYNLMAEGVLESGANGTVFVPSLDEPRIRELSLIRIRLEGLAAREAMPNLAPKDFDRLSEINSQFAKTDKEKEHAKLMQLNWQFHFGLYEAANMPTLLKIIETCWLKMGSYLNVIYPDYGSVGVGRDNHARILAALQGGDANLLEDHIRTDIEQSTAWVIQMIRDRRLPA